MHKKVGYRSSISSSGSRAVSSGGGALRPSRCVVAVGCGGGGGATAAWPPSLSFAGDARRTEELLPLRRHNPVGNSVKGSEVVVAAAGNTASASDSDSAATTPLSRRSRIGKGVFQRGTANEQDCGGEMPGQEVKRRPVILLDVMGTIIRDPFHVDMPAFFGITFKELMAGKHPTAWLEFENGQLTEDEFAVKLFNDRRHYDYEGLKQCMTGGYEYLEGMEALLKRLKAAGFDLHVFSNYPCWYTMIEDKLKLSQYLPWTFVSCHTGLRKPAPEAFLDAVEWLGVHPSDCIFIDDQLRNVEAALKLGMKGLQFQNARVLEKELAGAGVSLEPQTQTQITC